MTKVPVLKGKWVTLRPLQPSDKRDRLKYSRNAEFVRMCGGNARQVRPLTEKEVDEWYDRLVAALLTWAIEVGGRFVGMSRLSSPDEHNRRARYAIGIYAPSCWGQGFGTEATRLVLRYAFDTLKLHRVDLRVLSYNHRAIACYENCGFVREGAEREEALLAGEYHTDVMMSILEHEYREVSKEWS